MVLGVELMVVLILVVMVVLELLTLEELVEVQVETQQLPKEELVALGL